MELVNNGFRLSIILLVLGIISLFFVQNWIYITTLLFAGLVGTTVFPIDKGRYFGIRFN